MRILVAEDDRVSARVLEKALEKLGHEPVLAFSGAEAWELAQGEEFQVVISDWMMPGIEGPELCRKIRAKPAGGNYCCFIILTAKGQKEDRLEAMHAGADDFLSKPLDREELSARLAAAQRILSMQKRLKEQNDELHEQRKSVEHTNQQLQQQREELGTALRSLEATSRIAEVSRNRFSQLFEGLPVACFTYDPQGVVFEWNRRSEDLFGVPPHKALGKHVSELMGSSSVAESVWETMKGVFKGEAFVDREWADSNRHLLVSGLPLYGPDGTITGGIIAAVDITRQRLAEEQIGKQLIELNLAHKALEELNGKLAALATTDALTGIPNHRALQDRLAQMVADGERGRKFALAMVDVDMFREFNNEFGHQAGDEVLASVAAALSAGLRKTDFVARYGGEEFCVLFADVDEGRAARLCENLRAGVARIENRYRNVTASFGVAAFGGKILSGQELIGAADEALYKAKKGGRNRVVRHSDRKKKDAA